MGAPPGAAPSHATGPPRPSSRAPGSDARGLPAGMDLSSDDVPGWPTRSRGSVVGAARGTGGLVAATDEELQRELARRVHIKSLSGDSGEHGDDYSSASDVTSWAAGSPLVRAVHWGEPDGRQATATSTAPTRVRAARRRGGDDPAGCGAGGSSGDGNPPPPPLPPPPPPPAPRANDAPGGAPPPTSPPSPPGDGAPGGAGREGGGGGNAAELPLAPLPPGGPPGGDPPGSPDDGWSDEEDPNSFLPQRGPMEDQFSRAAIDAVYVNHPSIRGYNLPAGTGTGTYSIYPRPYTVRNDTESASNFPDNCNTHREATALYTTCAWLGEINNGLRTLEKHLRHDAISMADAADQVAT
ncbi:hypothetical protein I4F81_012752 [Pyropia yezoensis]|uniref:Uncharacterized protein n=1 Tax=Pyropia yezoensis TaxID=2788 RepID=A0ACC3CJW7_PYRYE|nr:hypothetical protein I4F81_012752 [Neopyropia yezoensis]